MSLTGLGIRATPVSRTRIPIYFERVCRIDIISSLEYISLVKPLRLGIFFVKKKFTTNSTPLVDKWLFRFLKILMS